VKKVLAITSIRSDYDLMSELFKLLHKDPEVELKLLISGAHLSSSYGLTVRQVETDGFDILMKVESLLDSDTKVSRLKSSSIMLLSCIDIVSNYAPDMIVYAGDREDVLMGGMLSAYLGIPSLHFFGGDHVVDGHVDNLARHACSKLSTVHFVSIPEHGNRLVSLGESKERIFNIGSVSLDKFYQHTACNAVELEQRFATELSQGFAISIFHPHTDENEASVEQFKNILSCLAETELRIFVSAPNIDPGNKELVQLIDELKGNEQFIIYKSLPREEFLDLFKNASFIIGNSSAGIIEAASVPIPAINVGRRQIGRACGKNVIFCHGDKQSINQSIKQALSAEMQDNIKGMANLYGNGKSSLKAYNLIKSLDFQSMLLKTEDPLSIN